MHPKSLIFHFASWLHLWWAYKLLTVSADVAADILKTTPLANFTAFGVYYTSVLLIVISVLAIFAASSASVEFMVNRLGANRGRGMAILLLLPQQVFMLMSSEAVYVAVKNGSYPDHTIKSGDFISVDQAITFLFGIFHLLALLKYGGIDLPREVKQTWTRILLFSLSSWRA